MYLITIKHSKLKYKGGKIMTNEEQVKLNRDLAKMLKGGVIMDVTTPEQAKIAEDAGACGYGA